MDNHAGWVTWLRVPVPGGEVIDILAATVCAHRPVSGWLSQAESVLGCTASCMIAVLAPSGRLRLLAGAGERDVPLGVGDVRADGDVPDGAAAGAVHHDGAGAGLGRGQQVPGPDACPGQFGAGQAQDAVGPRV